MELVSTSIAWAAGLFEGEGCVSLRLDKACPHMTVILAETDRDVVEEWASIWGLKVDGPYERGGGKHKDVWYAQTGRFDRVMTILGAMWPYLKERRREKIKEALGAMKEAGCSNRKG
jgi:hypothetical protein